MTLLLGSKTPGQILLSGDGLSTSAFHDEIFAGRTTLQKLFNFGPFAVGHYGDNWLKFGGQNVGMRQLVNYWYNTGIPERIDDALSSFRDFVAENVGGNTRGGFWIAACHDDHDLKCHRIEPPEWQLVELRAPRFKCGDGALFVPDDWTCHTDAFKAAIERQSEAGRIAFGGHGHQLKVDRDGCRWIKPWKNIGLGTSEILPDLPFPRELIDSPRDSMLADMNRLKDELWRSSNVGGKRRPGLGKMRDKWKAESAPDWRYVYQLVAIGDEAEHAEPIEVFDADALLYRAHVDRLVASLPR